MNRELFGICSLNVFLVGGVITSLGLLPFILISEDTAATVILIGIITWILLVSLMPKNKLEKAYQEANLRFGISLATTLLFLLTGGVVLGIVHLVIIPVEPGTILFPIAALLFWTAFASPKVFQPAVLWCEQRMSILLS